MLRLHRQQCLERPGEDYGYQRFYDVVRAFEAWPYGQKRCVVMTHRPLAPKMNEEFFAGSRRELVEKLGAEGVKRVYVDGGAVTVSQVPVLLVRQYRRAPIEGGGEPGVSVRPRADQLAA